MILHWILMYVCSLEGQPNEPALPTSHHRWFWTWISFLWKSVSSTVSCIELWSLSPGIDGTHGQDLSIKLISLHWHSISNQHGKAQACHHKSRRSTYRLPSCDEWDPPPNFLKAASIYHHEDTPSAERGIYIGTPRMRREQSWVDCQGR
jgi:hypothetical protein